MSRYLLERFIQALITIWIVSVVIFVLARLSGDPITLLAPPEATNEEVAAIRHSYGLDKSWLEQYGLFIKGAVRGDFGDSVRFGTPASEIVFRRLPASLKLALVAMAISLTLGLTVGTLSGMRPGGIVDRVGKTLAILGQSVPVFWLAIVLILVFAVKLRWLPTSGYGGPSHFVLPAITLGWFFTASLMRLTRSAVLDVVDSDYVRFAYMKGLHPARIVTQHVLRNAAIPIVTLISIQFIVLVTDSVVTETIFAWPGIGRLLIDSVFARDFPVIQAVVFLVSVLFVVVNFSVDMLYGVLDPRIKYR
jgi:peptide/nickel transport system permease protein